MENYLRWDDDTSRARFAFKNVITSMETSPGLTNVIQFAAEMYPKFINSDLIRSVFSMISREIETLQVNKALTELHRHE